MFQNNVMRKTTGPTRENMRGNGEDCILRSFMICTHQILFVITSRRIAWAGHVALMGERKVVFVWRKL
jgi:hypothetical protein